MRIELEGRCVKLAVGNLSTEDAEKLVALGEAMEAKATNPSEGLAARRAFYAALHGCAGRPRMRRVILQLRDNVARYHLLTNRELSKKAHYHLRAAILAADAKTAGKVLKEHLEEARDDLLARLDETAATAS
jgi:DNA-binding GntR family transcriptional regulator